MLNKKLLGSVSSPPSDDNFENVSLLLSGDGTNGAQNNTFLDSSTNNFTITRNGNTTQGSFSPYGSNWGNFFNGSSTSLKSSPLGITSTNFTVEAWIYITGGSGNRVIATTYNVNPYQSNTMILTIDNANKINFSNGIGQAVDPNASPLNTWIHVAGVYTHSNTTLTLYVNGTSVATYVGAISNESVNGFFIGGSPGDNNIGTAWWNGYISNLRVVKSAVYTGNFTPSTVPLTAITNTALLTCQSNRFKDNSSNNFTLTVNGSPSVQRFSPFNFTAPYSTSVIGGSGYFDGSGDNLSIASNTALNLSSGDWTIEAFVFWTGANAESSFINKDGLAGSSFPSYQIGLNPSSQLRLRVGSGNGVAYEQALSDSSTFPSNQWIHVSAVKSGTTLSLYQNGSRVATATQTGTIIDGGKAVLVGWEQGQPTNVYMSGYISNARIVKGTAVYSGTTYTVPTAPLTAITNTSLLTNFTNAGIPDLAMQNDLETVGNAQVSTSVKKYGTGSLAFDGTGDNLNFISTPNTSFGTGDFTIEGWFYTNNIATTQVILQRRAALDARGIAIFLESSKLSFRAGDTNIVNSWEVVIDSGTLNSTTWYHFALTRSGNTWRGFVNGTQVGSNVTWSGTVVDETSPWFIGANFNNTTNLNGNIDDLRISKVARYTANFTPPASALPSF